ncbi:MAG TPA: lactate utilization protein [Verrucomicrobiae bacterium]|nr:lactate utilization protein [Verrucomicrobiae bacterium]
MTLTQELKGWAYGQKCGRAVEALLKNGFTAVGCETSAEAAEYILAEAAEARTVGLGGSMSVADMGVVEPLRAAGKELLIHGEPSLSREERLEVMRRQLTCDLFLTGTNALTLSGALVNIDATGNRAASMIFGPRKVIVVAGRNKLVEGTVEDALKRIKSCASPANARRVGFKTPCAATGLCSDCRSPERICRVTTVIERNPRMTDLRVLVVNEELGF